VETPGFENPKNSLGHKHTTTESVENSHSQAISAFGDNVLHAHKADVSRREIKQHTTQNFDQSERMREEGTQEHLRSNSMESLGSQRRSVRKSIGQIDNLQYLGSPDYSPETNKKYGAVRGEGNVVSIRATSQRYLSGEDSSAFTANEETSREKIPSIQRFNTQSSLNNIDPSHRSLSIENARFDSPRNKHAQPNRTAPEKKFTVRFFLIKNSMTLREYTKGLPRAPTAKGTRNPRCKIARE
jgi:hypothetical protein